MVTTFPIYVVIWEDITSFAGWRAVEVIPHFETLAPMTVGFMLEHTEDYLVLSQSVIEENGQAGEYIKIPTGNIQQLYVLNKATLKALPIKPKKKGK